MMGSQLRQVDDTVTDAILKNKYEDNPACEWAARIGVAGAAADALGSDKASRITGFLDLASDVMLMKCLRWPTHRIAAYFVGLLAVAFACANTLVSWIPASFFHGCTINNAPGTDEECERAGGYVRAFLRLVLTVLLFALVNGIVRLGLQYEVYDTVFFFANLLGRSVV